MHGAKKQAAIKAEAAVIYETITADMDKGWDSAEVQEQVAALHKNMGYFYDCPYGRFQGLGQMYRDDPKFRAFYEAMHPDMPDFLCQAITHYCQNAINEETAVIRQLRLTPIPNTRTLPSIPPPHRGVGYKQGELYG